jgi:rRNA-processing protein FCF1
MNSKDTIKHINSISDLQILSDLLQTETRVSVLAAISKRIEKLSTPEKVNEKKVKVKLHTGETHECLESEYLSALEFYGENYPGTLITK